MKTKSHTTKESTTPYVSLILGSLPHSIKCLDGNKCCDLALYKIENLINAIACIIPSI